MLKNQTVNHVSEHLSAICPVYTACGGGSAKRGWGYNSSLMPSEKQLQSNARKLRNEMTKQERHLWYDFLRNFEIQFYRQKVIENYIVDFYCARAKVVVELDGGQHFEDADRSKDHRRDERLKSLGYEVFRFTNFEVDHNFFEVCAAIRLVVLKRIAQWTVFYYPSPPFASLTDPPPKTEEGLIIQIVSG